MSEKKQQEAATLESQDDQKTRTEERPLWELLERVERRSNAPMFYELAESLASKGSERARRGYVN